MSDYVRCNLCGADDAALLYQLPVQPHQIGKFERDVWDVVQCRRCALVYENPRPDIRTIEAFYAFDDVADRTFAEQCFVNGADLQRATWHRILRVMGDYVPVGRLLDVGCGAGSFLTEASQSGYTAAGQDIAPYFVNLCRTRHRLTIYDVSLTTLAAQQPHRYECITTFDVLEHHPDPRQMLCELRQLLKPGGMLVVGTPNIGSFFARWYGVRWRQLYAIGHLTYFSRATLTQLLAACGFRVIRCGSSHTLDRSRGAERRNWITQFLKLIVLRTAVLTAYKPIAARVPALTHWQLRLGRIMVDHHKLLVRVGSQVIMNDDMICLATAN